MYVMALAIVFSTPVQAGEEIGWRGFALPRLAERVGLGGASLILGVVWAAWHLPFFYMAGTDNYGQSFPAFVLAVTGLSATLAWLYLRTGGSLFATMLLHAASNNTAGIVPTPSSAAAASNPFAIDTPLVGWLTAALLGLGGAWFLLRMRGANLAAVLAPSAASQTAAARLP